MLIKWQLTTDSNANWTFSKLIGMFYFIVKELITQFCHHHRLAVTLCWEGDSQPGPKPTNIPESSQYQTGHNSQYTGE